MICAHTYEILENDATDGPFQVICTQSGCTGRWKCERIIPEPSILIEPSHCGDCGAPFRSVHQAVFGRPHDSYTECERGHQFAFDPHESTATELETGQPLVRLRGLVPRDPALSSP